MGRLVAGGQEHQVDLLVPTVFIPLSERVCGDQQADFTGNVAWRMLVPEPVARRINSAQCYGLVGPESTLCITWLMAATT